MKKNAPQILKSVQSILKTMSDVMESELTSNKTKVELTSNKTKVELTSNKTKVELNTETEKRVTKSKKRESDTETEKTQFKTKKKIPLTLKKLVWDKYVGMNKGTTKCFCCKQTKILQMSFHAGHCVSEMNGGETDIDNLRPICQSCNSSMGKTNMSEFVKKCGLR